jgi:hypothetical protein
VVRRAAEALGKAFELNAAVEYYDDGNSRNAMATSEVFDASKPDGAVLLEAVLLKGTHPHRLPTRLQVRRAATVELAT